MPNYHARLSPSSADRWTTCTASISATTGIPNKGNDASREGTCCHQIQAECLDGDNVHPEDYIGREMVFTEHGEEWDEFGLLTGPRVIVTEAMADAVESAISFIRKIHATRGGRLEVEQRVPIGHFTGEEDAGGTSDTTIIGADWIWVGDSKYGRKKVMAYTVMIPAHEDLITGAPVPEVVRANLQMACYALGAIKKFDLRDKVKDITLCIVQPFLNHVSEYSCSIDELLRLEDWLRRKAEETRSAPVFAPSGDACMYCLAAGNCEAQTQAVFETAMIGFGDVAPRPKTVLTLGDRFSAIPMISDWMKATESRTRQALENNEPVVRSDGTAYKLVDGKASAREWDNDAEVEATVEKMRLKKEQTHSKPKLLSPAQMEPLWKEKKNRRGEVTRAAVLGPTQAKRLLEHITQGQNAPVIVLETDPRPARAKATDGFEDVADVLPNSDLF